ncbi:methionyl-tRNA synthetase [Haloferula luteola]|uniref:Methionine--tRNA ligase n=1 Tax=Haloferula luteola TaxID=595692 RepID=A0A840VHQ0_9BACT|nr:methionine--tRNA ligase [Haloferula luteola]MBB5353329.1 methionyl-tRNA synthetase [Haloferula luteola]
MLLTTAIDYTNGAPHIGHAYEKVLADVLARYLRLRGGDCYFLTGVDQHGQKVQQTAEKEGIHPATFAKKKTKLFLNLWKKLGVDYDGWAETTDERHKACVQQILTSLKEKGQLYKKGYQGFYSVRQEQFLTDRDRNEAGEFGPEWGEVVEIEEENWYFRLSDHAAWLKDFVQSHEDCVIPSFRRNELLGALERTGDQDLCISRPKERLRWGIEIPFDPDFVTYVWFDALINYASFAGYLADEKAGLPDFAQLWPSDGSPTPVHIIGKDILVPAHGIYWLCMLHAMGFPDEQLPRLLVHGWWNIKGEKMSKSLGNVVDPDALADRFGTDAVRYYLVRDIVTGKDSDFDPERLIMLYNQELANELGNLCNRALNMTARYTGGICHTSHAPGEAEVALRQSLTESTAAYGEAMDAWDTAAALKAINAHVSHCNAYLERNKPWELSKDESQRQRLEIVLAHAVESLAHLTVLLSPVLPEPANRLAHQLRFEKLLELKFEDLTWGLIEEGHETGKPKPVFPRIVLEEE